MENGNRRHDDSESCFQNNSKPLISQQDVADHLQQDVVSTSTGSQSSCPNACQPLNRWAKHNILSSSSMGLVIISLTVLLVSMVNGSFMRSDTSSFLEHGNLRPSTWLAQHFSAPKQSDESDTVLSEEEATRRLSKGLKHNKTNVPLDYSGYSCDAYTHLQTKYPIRFNGCDFAHECNEGDGILFPSLFCDDTNDTTTSRHSNTKNILLLIFLTLALILLFRLLNSTTDEFFSPGLEMFSLQLGLPPRFAGVTLLALGNGAPDVAATMNAILGDEKRGYEMALGELTGTCMFVTSVIFGVIISVSGSDDSKAGNDITERKGIPCKGPLIRDIAVLVLVCAVSMSYLKSGVVDYGFVYTILGIYVAYVLLVLMADTYHILYHAPRRTFDDQESFISLKPALEEEGEDDISQCEKDKDNGESIADEGTSLLKNHTFRRSGSAPQRQCQHANHHLPHHNSFPAQHHSHSLGETVIEAMSNYSCSDMLQLSLTHSKEGADADLTVSPTNQVSTSDAKEIFKQPTKKSGWAPVMYDGTEPLAIFHPHHAVHPHHGPSGLLFVRSKSGATAAGPTNDSDHSRTYSCSYDDKNTGNAGQMSPIRKSSSCDASSLRPLDDQNLMATMQISIDTTTSSAVEEGSIGYDKNHIQIHHHQGVSKSDYDGSKPSSWEDAWKSNVQEFNDHWKDLYIDIYHNPEHGVLDVVFHTVELPFTIIRKLLIPVPCDGYYCRPLVASSLALSPLWLRFYVIDQYDTDLFKSHVGFALSAAVLIIALAVIRFAPGGEGPLDVWMVIPLTLYGFTIATTWLDFIADKLVELLELFGILLRIPATVMGLTVLAAGNSIQDLVANVTMSKKGLSTMATTACFAGPIFNFCVGLGLGFWTLLRSTGKDEIRVELPKNIATGFWFSIANCALIVFAGVVVGKGVIGQGYGYVAGGLYVIYVITSLVMSEFRGP